MSKKMKKFLSNIEAKAKVSTVAILMIIVTLSAVFIMVPDMTIKVQAADTTDFDNFVVLTIDHDQVPGTLTNFVVCAYNSSWETGLNSTSFSFFQSDNSTECNWELERYDHVTGNLTAWVNVTSISSSSDTTFYLYYDSSNSSDGGEHNPTGTWDGGYAGVYHFDDASGMLTDSTSNSNDANESGGTISYRQTHINFSGYAMKFENYGNFTIPDDNSFDSTGTRTVSYTVLSQPTALTGSGTCSVLLRTEYETGYPDITIKIDDSPNVFQFNQQDDNDQLIYAKSDVVRYNDSYYIMLGKVDDQNLTLLDDSAGFLAGSGDAFTGSLNPVSAYHVGLYKNHQFDTYNDPFTGYIDELRISTVARSNDSMVAEYNNYKNRTTFITFGDTGSGSSGVYEISGLDGDTRFTWSGEATDSVWANATGATYETFAIHTNLSGTSENCTDIFIDFVDMDTDIVQENFSIEVKNSVDGSWDGTTYTVPSSDGNVTINQSVWTSAGWCHGTNPFSINGTDVTIHVRVKCGIPGGKAAGTYTIDSWAVNWKVITS